MPFPQLSPKAAEADTFKEFKTSLMSVGKTADDGNISVFTKEDVKVYKEKHVLITSHLYSSVENGNRRNQLSDQRNISSKPTAYATYHPQKRQSSRCMQHAAIR